MADTPTVKHYCCDMLGPFFGRKSSVRSLLWLLFLIPSMEVAMAQCDKGLVEAQARQEIEYLRRWYAKATDKQKNKAIESLPSDLISVEGDTEV